MRWSQVVGSGVGGSVGKKWRGSLRFWLVFLSATTSLDLKRSLSMIIMLALPMKFVSQRAGMNSLMSKIDIGVLDSSEHAKTISLFRADLEEGAVEVASRNLL